MARERCTLPLLAAAAQVPQLFQQVQRTNGPWNTRALELVADGERRALREREGVHNYSGINDRHVGRVLRLSRSFTLYFLFHRRDR